MKQQSLNEIAKEIFSDNKAKGFWDQERNIGELLMLVTSELAEALEADRNERHYSREGNNADREIIEEYEIDCLAEKPNSNYFKERVKDTFEDEIADAFIRLFDLAGGLDIDIDFHIRAKLNYNKNRPQKHGKNY